jgi:hypothetical protein
VSNGSLQVELEVVGRVGEFVKQRVVGIGYVCVDLLSKCSVSWSVQQELRVLPNIVLDGLQPKNHRI